MLVYITTKMRLRLRDNDAGMDHRAKKELAEACCDFNKCKDSGLKKVEESHQRGPLHFGAYL